MTGSESHDHDQTMNSCESNDDRSGGLSSEECHETVDQETRDAMLVEYSHRCQLCGRLGPEKGGLAKLDVHHIERDPDGMDEHDMDNLTLLCRVCHSWFHQQSKPEDAPVELTEADQAVLLSQDIEILQYFADHGPARTGDIVSGLSIELSVSAVRERLWVLMGLDNLVETRDRQIVDKDIETGEWGLVEQVENSARGHIPDDPQLLLQRVEDEQVRQALDRECDRSSVTEAFGIARRTTFNKVKRACAYDFPLDAFNRGGRRVDRDTSDPGSPTPDTVEDNGDEQKELDVVVEQDTDTLGRTETWGKTVSETEALDLDGGMGKHHQNNEDFDDDLRVHLQEAITALQEVHQAL